MKLRNCVCCLLASASFFAFVQPALAQATPPPASTKPDKAPLQPDESRSQEIIVTGSRVLKDGSASPTPLTTISTESLVSASPSGTISDALNNLPVFSGSRGSFSNPGSNATGVQGGNGNANVLNLRNLGTTRTLVLFDGHRVPPTLFNGTVDVDIIPQELIKNVDIVTGGVSAVYGSDAVSGVVNYVLDRNFNGLRAHGEAGISQYGDAATRDIGAAVGFKVGDRGHFEASVEHREADGISTRVGSRKWLNLAAIQGSGTTADPYYLGTNVRLPNYSFGGYIPSGALAGQTFGSDSTLGAFDRSTDGAYQNASMMAASKGTQVFGRLDYELTDDIHFYVQGAGNFKKSTAYTGWNQLAGLKFSANNAYLPAAYQDALADAGQSTFTMNEILSAAPRIQTQSSTQQIYANAGLNGTLGNWDWDTTYTHGVSRLHTVVNFNGAARYTDYSTSGHYWTWKLGGVWEVNDDIKFRGTLSRDIRAPNLYELFQPASTVWGNFNLRNSDGTYTTSYAPSVNVGNADLKAEIGHTYTFGTVLKPSFLPGVTLTVDYYHTVVDDAITTVQGFNAATQTACATTGTYCELIDTSGATPIFYIKPYNLSKIKTWGIDGELDYHTRLAGQPLSMRLLANYQPHIYYIQPGAATIDQGDAGWGQNGLMPSPSVQLSAFLGYQVTDTFKVDLFEHYRNRFRRSGVATQVFLDPWVRSYATTNLTFTFDTGSAWKITDSQLTFSVSNLFNATPPLSGYYSGTTAAGQAYEFSDDPTGRAFMVGFKIQA